ncbi:MAG TPA: methyltransferase domain-containing protein [Dehalococcoidia bacterium]|nr:methyltransferase domain-containing protein [Dehalococcoidia bacterium]
MTTTIEGFSLDKFARHPFYIEVNRRLVQLAELRQGFKVVDLGAGTGAVTRLLAEAVRNKKGAEVIAVEPSESALEVARRNLENIRGAVVRFVQGGAERLSSLVKRQVDAVFFCNAIHLVNEKNEVLQEINRTLRQEGTFSFNTTFYEGGEPPESELFYRRWMMKSLRTLKREYGLTPDLSARAMARERLSEADYVALLERNGFRVLRKEVVRAEMSLESFQDISEYYLWIEGILPGVPLEAGSRALKQSACETFQELGLTSSCRNWLLIVAHKE